MRKTAQAVRELVNKISGGESAAFLKFVFPGIDDISDSLNSSKVESSPASEVKKFKYLPVSEYIHSSIILLFGRFFFKLECHFLLGSASKPFHLN